MSRASGLFLPKQRKAFVLSTTSTFGRVKNLYKFLLTSDANEWKVEWPNKKQRPNTIHIYYL